MQKIRCGDTLTRHCHSYYMYSICSCKDNFTISGPQKVSIFGPTASNSPRNGYCPHQNHYVLRHINNRYINSKYFLRVQRSSVGWRVTYKGCSVAQIVVRRPAVRQPRVQFSARHTTEVFPPLRNEENGYEWMYCMNVIITVCIGKDQIEKCVGTAKHIYFLRTIKVTLQRKLCAASVSISKCMCLWAIYMFLGSVHIFSCRSIGRPIVGIYKSLTATWLWKLGERPRNPFLGNVCFKFSVLCLCRAHKVAL